MADDLNSAESNTKYSDTRQWYLASSESESMACNESVDVNVGDPIYPHRNRVSTDKYNSEEVEMVNRKSEQA